MFKYLLLWAAIVMPVFAQNQGGGITQPGAARATTINPTTLSCNPANPDILLYNNGGTVTPYTCGPGGVYIQAPGGSTSTLTASGVGASGAAGANKLTGPASSIITTDSSGNGSVLPTVSGDGTLNAGTGALAVSKIAGQVPGSLFPLNIPAAGPTTSTGSVFRLSTIPDYVSLVYPTNTLSYGNGATNSIASTIAAFSSNPNFALIPPNYATTETVPGYFFTPFGLAGGNYTVVSSGANTPGSISGFWDMRHGWRRIYNNLPLITDSQGNGFYAVAENFNFNTNTNLDGGLNFKNIAISEYMNNYGRGRNYCSDFTAPALECNKSTMQLRRTALQNWGQGQTVASEMTANCYGAGDCQANGANMLAYGGANAGSDEGAQQDNVAATGSAQANGTCATGCTTGSTSITASMNVVTGRGTQGDGRPLIWTVSPYTTGTIASFTPNGSGPTVVVGTGTGWTPSTDIGTIAGNFAAGTQTYPLTFTTGSISDISTTTKVCVFDHHEMECFYPTSVNAGASTITVVALYPHASPNFSGMNGAGQTGEGFGFDADFATQATTPMHTPITGTLRQIWQVAQVDDATHLRLYVYGKGFYQGLQSRFKAIGNNAYHVYPYAQTYDVQSGGGVNAAAFVLTPNDIPFTVGGSFEVVLGPNPVVAGPKWTIEHPWPNIVGTGPVLKYNMLTGNDTGFAVENDAPCSNYSACDSVNGTFTAAPAIDTVGEFLYNINSDIHGDNGFALIGCPSVGCVTSKTVPVLTMVTSTTADTQSYNHSNGAWSGTAGKGAATWSMTGSTYQWSGGFRVGSAQQFQVQATGATTLPSLAGTGSVPVITGCGTSPTLTTGSTNLSGSVLEGSGATGCTITWAVAFTATPISSNVTATTGLTSYSASTTAIVVVNSTPGTVSWFQTGK